MEPDAGHSQSGSRRACQASGQTRSTFPGIDSYRPESRVHAVAATYSDHREISLTKRLFRLRTEKFRLRNDFVSQLSEIQTGFCKVSKKLISCYFNMLRRISQEL